MSMTISTATLFGVEISKQDLFVSMDAGMKCQSDNTHSAGLRTDARFCPMCGSSLVKATDYEAKPVFSDWCKRAGFNSPQSAWEWLRDRNSTIVGIRIINRIYSCDTVKLVFCVGLVVDRAERWNKQGSPCGIEGDYLQRRAAEIRQVVKDLTGLEASEPKLFISLYVS
jgi:hypothetical protein